MTTLVHFRSGGTNYALPVENVTEVRVPEGIVALPSSRPGVAGTLERDSDSVTVLDTGATNARHMVIARATASAIALLVDEVTGVRSVTEALRPAPHGQEEKVIAGTVRMPDGEVVLVLDIEMLTQTLSWPVSEDGFSRAQS